MMKKMIAAIAMLAASACATQEAAKDTADAAAPFMLDADGYFRLPIGPAGAAPDPEKMGAQMAQGEMYCRQTGKTAEIGFVTGPNGDFFRFRCVTP